MRFLIAHLLILFCFVVSAKWVFPYLAHEAVRQQTQIGKDYEVLYLPKASALKALSFGFQNALADTLWFRTVSYFGKHYKEDQKYEWLAHMCELVVALDPKAAHVYEFGALMLTWEADRPAEAIALLDKAIAEDATQWRPYYLRGFTRYYFMDDNVGAAQDFEIAARLPDAPVFLAGLAAKKLQKSSENPAAAVQFLAEMIRNTQDPSARRVLGKKLRKMLAKMPTQGGSQ
jgi:hypothetical protein